MEYQEILYRVTDCIATITLNRPIDGPKVRDDFKKPYTFSIGIRKPIIAKSLASFSEKRSPSFRESNVN